MPGNVWESCSIRIPPTGTPVGISTWVSPLPSAAAPVAPEFAQARFLRRERERDRDKGTKCETKSTRALGVFGWLGWGGLVSKCVGLQPHQASELVCSCHVLNIQPQPGGRPAYRCDPNNSTVIWSVSPPTTSLGSKQCLPHHKCLLPLSSLNSPTCWAANRLKVISCWTWSIPRTKGHWITRTPGIL